MHQSIAPKAVVPGESDGQMEREHRLDSPQTSLLNARPGMAAQRKLADMIHNSPRQEAQRKAGEVIPGKAPQMAQLQLAGHVQPVQLEQTVSGHGSLRRDAQNALVNYTVPAGKTVIRAAPPGATLGDISKVLNTTTAPDPAAMRLLIKVNTTPEFWTNIAMVTAVKDNAAIPKTPTQAPLLAGICDASKPFANLTGPQKNSVNALERRAEFEAWAKATVAPHTFAVINAASVMNDMVLSAFEDALQSGAASAAQNHYINAGTTLSAHIAAHPGQDRFVVNACSHDANATYTGFQIDKA